MKIKTSELTGEALDACVRLCVERDAGLHSALKIFTAARLKHPSTDWAQGGPIIEREQIGIDAMPTYVGGVPGVVWTATAPMTSEPGRELMLSEHGPTPLIAAMRCYVASKLGDKVEVPDELV